MIITLYTNTILAEVRQKSHLEVQDIADAEARDNARAGVEKTDEINRCILYGIKQVSRRLIRFLHEGITMSTDNTGTLEASYAFALDFAERRAINKAEPLEDAMHNFVVQRALEKFCISVNQLERAKKHAVEAEEYGDQIDEMMYHKQPPRV